MPTSRGRPSTAPEKLLRAMLLQVLHSIRSERQLMEQTQYKLLFRWLIGLSMDDSVWVPTVFTQNRERVIRHDAVFEFFNEELSIAQKKNWLSGEHFSVDGTLIQAWAGHKSFARKDGDDRTHAPRPASGSVSLSMRFVLSTQIISHRLNATPPASPQ
jgi:transposase